MPKKIALVIFPIIILLSLVFLLIKILSTDINNPYKIVLVGDSMTAILGENVSELKDYLKKDFPNQKFEIINYSLGSTNIFSVDDRLEKISTISGRIHPPILKQDFDLIIIESFGHNPLSQYKLKEGLEKQTHALTSAIYKIKQTHPESRIVFLATIAPHKTRYGEGSVVLMPDKRIEWAKERVAYIENHIKFAKENNIPLVNIYQKSLDEKGGGNIDYINTKDFIHPSPTGVYLISKEIADFIKNNHLF
ncbi:SGNH/GDSL hydrolase family protein [Candidatus Daviesbacteria bacterium]|nr:SGNH/GDSL hydrolase family protein [Candidatus Daviesbacteria bacterium]